MNPGVITLAILAPFAIFATALIVRLVADAQPESASFAHYRRALIISSYCIIAVGFMALGAGIFITGIVGLTQLLLFALGAAQLADVEAIIFGQRRRAQQAELLWMLASTVKDQRSLADELELYASGTWGRRHRRLIELVDRLREGTPLTEIAVPQGLLPPAVTLEVQGGLQAGRLHEALRDAAARHTKSMIDNSGTTKLQMTMMHPAAVMIASILIVGFLMYWIVPKFKKIFQDFNSELPEVTKWLISFSDSFVSYALILQPVLYFPIIAAIVLAMAEIQGWSIVSRRVFGAWSARPYAPELLRALAQAVAGGLPLTTAINSLSFSMGSVLVHQRMAAVRLAMSQGESCWKQLERQGFVNTREAVLLESAEAVGNLPWSLNAVADGIERRWTFRLHALLEFFGPAVALLMGFFVAFLAIAFFLPLVKLLNDLS